MADDKKHYCIKTADGKNETVGINLITSKKGTDKEKVHIKRGLKKEIDSTKTNLNKESLLVTASTIKNVKTNETLKLIELEKTNKKIDKKHYTELINFVYSQSPKKNINRKKVRNIKGRK